MSQDIDKKIILIVDDTPENITILHHILRADFKTKAATNGKKALSIALKTPQPDLILLDILMPDMDGFEVLSKLKSNPLTMSIPIIFVSGKETDLNEYKGLVLGAVGYVSKPVSAENLLMQVRRQFDK